MKHMNKEKVYLLLIFIFVFSIRLICISNPPLDMSSWRQVDTDSIARNFLRLRFNIFYPQLNYDGPPPNYVQLEFQVTTFIISLLYRTFGISPILGRAVPIAFFTASCWFLYRLVRIYSGTGTAAAATLLYGIFPINVVYSRNIMPDSALMCFTIGAMYYFARYDICGGIGYYILSAVFTALAVLTKPPAALIGVPMIYIAVRKKGRGVFRDWKLMLFPLVTLGVPYIYFMLQGRAAEQKFVEGIGGSLILPNFLKAVFRHDSLAYLFHQFGSVTVTVPGLILFGIGLLTKPAEGESFYYAWLCACVMHIAFIDAVIHLDYYLMFVTPVFAIFAARACDMFVVRHRALPAFLLVFLICLYSAAFAGSAYRVQHRYIELGRYVAEHTDADDLIIIDRPSPELFYTSDRKGWRLYGSLLTSENIERLASEGADYFVPSEKSLGLGMEGFLDSNYVRITLPDGYWMYKLS